MMQYELVQNASTWLIIFIAIAGVATFVQLFIHAYWTCYRHQRSPKQQACNQVSQRSSRGLQAVMEPKQLNHDKSQTPLNIVFDLEVKRRPFWYSIG